MQRLLIFLSALVVLPLAGCWHEAFHTSFENATGQKIYLIIHFDVKDVPPGHGYVEPGNRVNLPQKIDNIDYIEYQIDGRKCRFERQAITTLVNVQEHGMNRIILRDCGRPHSQ